MILKCKNCGKKFEWFLYQKPNSTIKPKQPEICQMCHNKKLLSRSTFARPQGQNKYKAAQYTIQTKKGRKTSKKTSKQRAIDTADRWFSRWVRINFFFHILPDGDALSKCYTCGKVKLAKTLECGHWQRRGYKATRYHENNARPQCNRCNYRRSGEHEKFEINLIEEVGQDQVNELKKMGQDDFKDSLDFYREVADKYRRLTNDIIEKLEIKKWW